MSKPRTPRAPKGLGPEGTRFWREITGKYVLRFDELQILRDACREIDLCERLEDALREAPLTVKGSQGQDVASPFVSELRQHRMTVKGLLASLKLPNDDEAGAESGPTSASSAAIAMNRARWSKPAAGARGA